MVRGCSSDRDISVFLKSVPNNLSEIYYSIIYYLSAASCADAGQVRIFINRKKIVFHLVCCFSSQNGNIDNPYCNGMEGILEAYHQSLKTVQLYGPTNFAPVVNHVARYGGTSDAHRHLTG